MHYPRFNYEFKSFKLCFMRVFDYLNRKIYNWGLNKPKDDLKFNLKVKFRKRRSGKGTLRIKGNY